MGFRVYFLLIFSLFIFGCSTKAPTSVGEIKEIKHQTQKIDIQLTNKNEYEVYIDSDDKIRFICKVGSPCNYYDKEKHSYDNFFVDEEVFFIAKDGYNPYVKPKNLQCGVGSKAGYLALISDKFAVKDYTKKNKTACNYRYTKVDDTQILDRTIFGLLTFGTSFISAGNMHKIEFDKDEFVESIYNSNIESYRVKLLDKLSHYNIDGGFDIIYLEVDDVEDNLEDKYEQLLYDKSKKAGIIFLREDTRQLISIIVFDKYKDDDIFNSISKEISELLLSAKKNSYVTLEYEDIIKYIPPEISIPKIPAIKKPIKSEYEKKAAFYERVKNLVAKREATIRELQREYSLAVLNRNKFIDKLQKEYERYLMKNSDEKNQLLKDLEKNSDMLVKIMFLENISGFDAKSFQYDAETDKLFFKIYSRDNTFSQDVVATIPAQKARKIKENKTYKILPTLEYKNSSLKIKYFEILETTTGSKYKTIGTNINFIPEIISVSVGSEDENIEHVLSTKLQKYKQKDKQIIDISKKEIWYIDVASRLNAKVPKWFSSPKKDGKIISYGEGNSLLEAKTNARTELSKLIHIDIKSTDESKNIFSNFSKSINYKEQTIQTTKLQLQANEYKLIRQEHIDGIWYVAYEYLK
jgi:hypothetical protein